MKAKLLTILTASFLLSACQPEEHQIKTPLYAKSEENQYCNKTVPFGFPQSKSQNTYFVCHDGYTLEYQSVGQSTVWTSYLLLGDDVKRAKQRPIFETDYRDDVRLPKGASPLINNYADAKDHYKRHRLVPKEDFKHNKKLMSQTDYMTNVFPIYRNNEVVLDNLEKLIRKWAEHYGAVFVMSGTAYSGNKNLGEYGYKPKENEANNPFDDTSSSAPSFLAVPTHVYKLVFVPKAKFNMAFIIPNTPLNNANPMSYLTTEPNLEAFTRINFYPRLSDIAKKELVSNPIPKDIPLKLGE